MTTPTHGWDQSWGHLKPKDAKAAGLGVVAGYLSFTPSKNLTVADIRGYHHGGIGCIPNWESAQGRPLLGASAGHEDGKAARQQLEALIAGVGQKPQNKLCIYFSCDTEVTEAQFATIADYYRAAKVELGDEFDVGVYGQASLVQYLHEQGITRAEWQTLAWSQGVVYRGADYYQTGINAHFAGADIDYDDVRHAQQLGAWWPPGHPLDAPRRERRVLPPPPTPKPPRRPHKPPTPKAHHYRWRISHLLARIGKLRARLTHRKGRR